MAVNPKNQIRNIFVRIKNQSEYMSVSESGPHIYAMSIPSRSYKSLGWGYDNHMRMVNWRKPIYTVVWQRIMRIDDINELNTSTREPGKWFWWALVPFFSNDGTTPVIWAVSSYPGWMPIFVSLFNDYHESELLFGRLVQLLSFFCDSSPIVAFLLF